MNATVTGGTGFLGRSLLRLLLSQADEVRVLVRRPDDEPTMRALGAVPIRGDLTAPDGCRGLVREGDVVFHAAARVDLAGSWSDFVTTTVEGTRRLLAEALPARPARMVYVSSASVYSPAHARGGACADRTPTVPPRHGFYARAKLAAENLIRTACARAGCPWVIIRLGFLYGPGNRALGKYFVPMLERGRLRVIGHGRNRIATLYVDDAARAVLLAGMHPAAAGKVYDVASNEPVTQREFLDANADAVGLRRPGRNVPRAAAYAAAAMSESAAWFRGRPPEFTRAMVILMSIDQALDTARIRQELEWSPQVSFTEGMRRMREWYRERDATDQVHAGKIRDRSPTARTASG